MEIAFFGSSLVSAYWNGAATYYRGIIKALADRGHRIRFFEPDAYERQQHRDMEDPPWAEVAVYSATPESARAAVRRARHADLIVKASGVGVMDDLLETELLDLKTESNWIVFWDVDAPATLESVARDPQGRFASRIPQFDAIFTYGGGEPVVRKYLSHGARHCVPIYNALDPRTHHPVNPDPRFESDLAFLGNRLPDREARVEEFLLKPAANLPKMQFLLGGAGWGDKPMTPNVHYADHIYTRDHNAFNCTPRAVLNISRDSMARIGFSPATRVFEAAGAGACIITDAWEGIELFLEPEVEILVARNGEEVLERIDALTVARAHRVGQAARRRILARHTYAHRAELVEIILEGVDRAHVEATR